MANKHIRRNILEIQNLRNIKTGTIKGKGFTNNLRSNI